MNIRKAFSACPTVSIQTHVTGSIFVISSHRDLITACYPGMSSCFSSGVAVEGLCYLPWLLGSPLKVPSFSIHAVITAVLFLGQHDTAHVLSQGSEAQHRGKSANLRLQA